MTLTTNEASTLTITQQNEKFSEFERRDRELEQKLEDGGIDPHEFARESRQIRREYAAFSEELAEQLFLEAESRWMSGRP